MKAGRIVSLLLILALLASLCGCGAPEKKDSADSAVSSVPSPQVVVHTDPYTDVTGKKVGISIRKRLYTGQDKDGNPVDRETIEIGKFETVDDVRNGKCKLLRDRDTRKKKNSSSDDSTDGSGFTDVSSSVSVPW